MIIIYRADEIDLNFMDKNEASQEFDLEEVINKDVSTNQKFYHKLVYTNVVLFTALHTCAFIGIYQLLVDAKMLTILWCKYIKVVLKLEHFSLVTLKHCLLCKISLSALFLGISSGEAIALGAHRYYSHKSFKATTSLRVAMLVFQLIAGQVRQE